MKKDKRKILGEITEKSVVLCKTTDAKTLQHTVNALLLAQISFTKKWERFSFIQRIRTGCNEVCVIYTHPTQYARARRTLDNLETSYRERLMIQPA